MIIYDQASWGGWGILFHGAGSAMYNKKSILPALFSAMLSGIYSNTPEILDFFAPKVLNGTVIFSSIQFLVSLIVVNRVREAGIRFNATQEAYIRFYTSLLNLAFIVTAAIDNPKTRDSSLDIFRMRFLRWCRALHVLAVEEFQGFEVPELRCGVLIFTEEVLLFQEKRKPTRLMNWLFQGLLKEKPRLGWEPAIETNMWRVLGEVFSSYSNTRRMAAQIYPFPLAQSSLICCVAFGLFSPFSFATMLPASTFLAPCIAFISVWLTFGFNLAAEMLEWPFDGRANNLPMGYYSLRFIHDINTIEYSSVSPLWSVPLSEVIPKDMQEHADELEFDLPRPRPFDKKESAKMWLERARKDFATFAGRRRKLRNRLRPLDPVKRRRQENDIIGDGIPEMRTNGVFRKLW